MTLKVRTNKGILIMQKSIKHNIMYNLQSKFN